MPKLSITIDATNQPPGRLASRIAVLLMGKNSASFRRNRTVMQKVTVRNCAKIRIDKRKFSSKRYYRTSGHPGGLQSQPMGDLFRTNPADVLRRAVAGMLPNNALRAKRLQNLNLHNA